MSEDQGVSTEGDADPGTGTGADVDLDLSGTGLTQRLVLLGVIDLTRRAEATHSAAVVDVVVDHLEDIDADVVGSVSEAEVVRALNRLTAEGLLDEEITDASPAGKGRPTYSVAVDTTAVFDAFADDRRVDEVVAHVRDGH